MSGERHYELTHHFPSISAFGASHPFPLPKKTFFARLYFIKFK